MKKEELVDLILNSESKRITIQDEKGLHQNYHEVYSIQEQTGLRSCDFVEQFIFGNIYDDKLTCYRPLKSKEEILEKINSYCNIGLVEVSFRNGNQIKVIGTIARNRLI